MRGTSTAMKYFKRDSICEKLRKKQTLCSNHIINESAITRPQWL